MAAKQDQIVALRHDARVAKLPPLLCRTNIGLDIYGGVTNVQFFNGSNLIGTGQNGGSTNWSFSWATAPVGTKTEMELKLPPSFGRPPTGPAPIRTTTIN